MIEASREQGTRRYDWLAGQLTAQGHDDLVAAYCQRKLDDAAALRMRDRERIIRQCDAQLAMNDLPPARRTFLERGRAKALRYLDQRQQKKE